MLALAGCAKCRLISLHRASRANPQRGLSIKRRRRCRAHVRAIRSTSDRVSLAFGPPIEIGRLYVATKALAFGNSKRSARVSRRNTANGARRIPTRDKRKFASGEENIFA